MRGLTQRVERISANECKVLLRRAHIGRIGIVDGDQPLVLPVNYQVVSDSVVFRTETGSTIERLTPAQVSFEIDGVDTHERTGWSVLVKGRAHDVSDSVDAWSEALRQLIVESWAPGEKATWIGISIKEITGFQLV